MPIHNPAPGGGGGGPATQLDANGTILDVNAIADGEVLKRVGLTVVGVPVGAPGAHASTHQNGGVDEITIAGLSGVAADPQTPDLTAHLAASDPHTQYALDAALVKPIGWHRPPASPNAKDDEFTAATLDLVKWEKFNHGTSIIDTEPLVQRLIMQTPVGVSGALRTIRQPAPAGAFSISTCLTPYANNIVANNRIAGLWVRSSGVSGGVAGRIMLMGFQTFTAMSLTCMRWTDENTWASTILEHGLATQQVASFTPPYWFKMEWTGSAWNMYINPDGDPNGWSLFTTDTNAFLGSAFSHVGLLVYCNTAAMVHRAAFHHFRVT